MPQSFHSPGSAATDSLFDFLREREPCKNPPIQGGTVCRFQGGGAPQVEAAARHRTELVKAEAQGRLEAMLEGAISRIEELSQQDAHLPTSFNAAKHT